jgi:hypothetical protein
MKYLFTLLSFCSILFVSAQEREPVRCGTTEYLNHLEKENPGAKDAYNAVFFDAIKKSRMDIASNKTASVGYDTTYCIPVVFHVLWNSFKENIPDSVIIKQLNQLTLDFTRRTRDTDYMNSSFIGVASRGGIEFKLATIDPSGKPTTGIVRRNTNQLQFAVDMQANTGFKDMKQISTGGDTAWDSKRYFNVWICNLIINGTGDGLLGFGQPPMNHPNWPSDIFTGKNEKTDGVVLDESCLNTPFFKVLTHEAGHYLGLRHIWGDVGDCSSPGDYIDDTPPQNASTGQSFDCINNTKNSCGKLSLIWDYMDYTADKCQNTFTKGQTDLMRNVLRTSRSGLAKVCKVKGLFVSITPTDLNEIKILNVYPNPTNDVLFFEAAIDNYFTKSFTVNVINELGQKVISETREGSNLQTGLNIQSLSKGAYIIEIQSEGYSAKSRFLVD